MPSLTQVLRSLGNAGAVANVQAHLDERLREDWLVAGLVSRLDLLDERGPAAQVATAPATRVA